MSVAPKKFLKRAFKGVKSAATTTTTALGTVASEIAGTSVLQPNSPQAKVQTALESANKSRLVRLWSPRVQAQFPEPKNSLSLDVNVMLTPFAADSSPADYSTRSPNQARTIS